MNRSRFRRSITFRPAMEMLETRLAPAVLVNPSTLTYQDVDGDTVTVHVSKGTLSQANFTFDSAFGNTGPQQLRLINLTSSQFQGANLSVTAVRSAVHGGEDPIARAPHEQFGPFVPFRPTQVGIARARLGRRCRSEADVQAIAHERYHHPDPRVQRQMEILWLKHLGFTHEEIATVAGVARSTVQRCLSAGVAAERCVLIDNAIDTQEFSRRVGTAAAKRQLGFSPERFLIGWLEE